MNLNKLGISLAHLLPPELSNKFSLEGLKILYNLGLLSSISNQDFQDSIGDQILGLNFPNKIGVAGGLDKNADYFHVLGKLGFGFVEVGTLTLKPQSGNPKPRIHRFTKEKNIVNSLGFNNVGIYQGLKNIEKNKLFFDGVLGISIGKSKETKIENAYKDYLHLIDYVYDQADYIAINISSPNTENLRDLSSDNYFKNLIEKIMNKKDQLNGGIKQSKPFILKISPDESLENLEKILLSCLEFKVDGLILNNSSVQHSKNLKGGISGNYIKKLSEDNLTFAKKICGNEISLISSGGIMTKEDVSKRFSLGADLIQLYSGFIFYGTDLLKSGLEI